MNKSESIKTIAAALAKAHTSIGAAVKGSDNPFFKSRYADLGSVMAVCKEPLSANGISVVQMPYSKESGEHWLETMLLHSCGEFIANEMKITPTKPNDLQSLGSAITYCRRYALQAMLSIPSVDDDAEWAERAARNKPAPEAEAEKTKAAVEAAGGKVTEIKPESESEKKPTESTADETAKLLDVECHIGNAGGPMLGKKVRELVPKVIRFLHDDWMVKLPMKPTNKDARLRDAVLARKSLMEAAGEWPGTPQEASKTPGEGAEGTPGPENGKETAKRAKAEALPRWQDVVIPSGKIKGKKLGELSDDELLNCYIYGIPRQKDVAFVAGVNAGMDEKKLTSPEHANRQEFMRRCINEIHDDVGVTNEYLTKASVLDDKSPTIPKLGDKEISYYLDKWDDVMEAVNKAKEDK